MLLTPLLSLTILLFGATLGALLTSLSRVAFRTRILAEVEARLTKINNGHGSATALPKQHVMRSADQHTLESLQQVENTCQILTRTMIVVISRHGQKQAPVSDSRWRKL